MSKVKTITASTTEQAVTFDATYQFAWFRNNSDVDEIIQIAGIYYIQKL